MVSLIGWRWCRSLDGEFVTRWLKMAGLIGRRLCGSLVGDGVTHWLEMVWAHWLEVAWLTGPAYLFVSDR